MLLGGSAFRQQLVGLTGKPVALSAQTAPVGERISDVFTPVNAVYYPALAMLRTGQDSVLVVFGLERLSRSLD
jgi:hypothetical protein